MYMDPEGLIMPTRSLSDIAYAKLQKSKKEVLFNDLWNEVNAVTNFPEKIARRKIASFYNAIMLDSRFISLEGNMWDLRERYADETFNLDPELLENYDDYDEDFEEDED